VSGEPLLNHALPLIAVPSVRPERSSTIRSFLPPRARPEAAQRSPLRAHPQRHYLRAHRTHARSP
jgi:hypothetical protein